MISKRFKNTLPLLALAAILGLTGCSANTAASSSLVVASSAESTTEAATSAAGTTAQTSTETESLKPITADDEDSDTAYNAQTATTIKLSDSGITIKGSGASAKASVLTISKEGTYVISGTLKAGQIIIAADKEEKVHLVFNGVSVTSKSGPALWIQSTEKAIVTLVKGTSNTLADSKTYVLATGEDEPDAALFSKEDLTINGTGSLAVSGNYAAGIKSKDSLLIMGGNVKATAVTHALSGKDAVGIFGGSLNLTSGEDGVHSSSQVLVKAGTLKIASGDDGIHADASLTVDGGTITIAKSYEGLESANITVNGGQISLTAADDGFNAAGGNDGSGLGGQPLEKSFSTASPYFIKINGGNIKVDASGDGIDANGSVYVTGGTVAVNGPTANGNGALDYDGTCEVTGGTLTIAGSSGMAQAPSATSSQNSVLVYYTNAQAAGTKASLVDSSGKTIISFTPSKAYQSMVFSSPSLIKGQTYSLVSGSTVLTKITLSKVTTSISDKGTEVAGGMGGPGMGGKGQRGVRPGTEGQTAPSGQVPPSGQQPGSGSTTDGTSGATQK